MGITGWDLLGSARAPARHRQPELGRCAWGLHHVPPLMDLILLFASCLGEDLGVRVGAVAAPRSGEGVGVLCWAVCAGNGFLR